MYEIIKRVIASGQYDLTAMLTKIDTIWIQGNLTDEQHDELIELARGGADTRQSVDLLTKIADLDARVRALETKDTVIVDPEDPDTPLVDVDNIGPFVSGTWYRNGDTIKDEDGRVFVCLAGQSGNPDPVVWSPKDYPSGWAEVVD